MPATKRKLTAEDRLFIANECLRELNRAQALNDTGRSVASLKMLIEDKGMLIDDADVCVVLVEMRASGHVLEHKGGPIADAPSVWQLTRQGIAYCQRRGLVA